jgi:hypothetical protein
MGMGTGYSFRPKNVEVDRRTVKNKVFKTHYRRKENRIIAKEIGI